MNASIRPAIEFLRLLVQFGPADYVLLILIVLFVASGAIYWAVTEKECRQLRGEIARLQRTSDELSGKEKTQREELNKALEVQNSNMQRIEYLKKQKIRIARMPVTLDKEIEELVEWCHRKNISVDFQKRQASRRLPPPGRKL